MSDTQFARNIYDLFTDLLVLRMAECRVLPIRRPFHSPFAIRQKTMFRLIDLASSLQRRTWYIEIMLFVAGTANDTWHKTWINGRPFNDLTFEANCTNFHMNMRIENSFALPIPPNKALWILNLLLFICYCTVAKPMELGSHSGYPYRLSESEEMSFLWNFN